MKRVLMVAAAVAALTVAAPAFAEDAAASQPAAVAASAEESPELFEASFTLDFLSAYVWRNVVLSDRMVMQPGVSASMTYFDPFYLGFSIWQNYNLTSRRRNVYKHSLDETDYTFFLGSTVWESDSGDYSLDLEGGYIWYSYHGVADGEDIPDCDEFYLSATFNNPFVSVYGQACWSPANHTVDHMFYYDIGLNKEFALNDVLTLGADWNVSFADPRFLAFNYGGVGAESDYEDNPSSGIGGTTLKMYLTWAITDWMSLGGVIAYTGVLNRDCRDSMEEQGMDYCFAGVDGARYPRDFVWGGLQLSITY